MAINLARSGLVEVKDILKQDADKGRVAVHSFDPTASPAEKGAAAGKAREQLKSVTNGHTSPAERGWLDIHNLSKKNTNTDIIATELQVPKGDINILPTITVEDIDSEKVPPPSPSPHDSHDVGTAAQPIPGGLPAHLAAAIPSWYKVGWRHMSGIDNPPLPEGEEKDKGILDVFLSEQFYGSWYHNAAVIVFVGLCASFHPLLALISHFAGRFCYTLPNPFWLRLGLAVHRSCYL
jgi:hypothetical protein